jgi:acyl-coenzyme A synthetase/AMP-(fatty) acid ligase
MRQVLRSSRVRAFLSWTFSIFHSLISLIELASHPDVLEVTVIARAHPKWGERAMAFVILRPQAVSRWAGKDVEFEADLKKHARGRLPGFACPEWVKMVEELPKTSTGKIQKVRLRQMIAKL